MSSTERRQGGKSIAYVIGSYPLLTTTFIDREIEVMRAKGISVQVVSLRRPHGLLSSDQSAEGVLYVRPVSPLRLITSHLRFLLGRPITYLRTLGQLISDPHPRFFQRIKTAGHFVLAVHVARLVSVTGSFQRVHAHFIDRAAVVALVVGRLLDLPYSATAHANDIYVDPVLLDRKLSEAKFVATCTGANAEHLRRQARGRARVIRLHHGLDVNEYDMPLRSGAEEPLLLAVGQLKEKKGFAYLIEACRLLSERGISFRLEIIGEGPLRDRLQTSIARAGLEGTVILRGALSHDEVKEAYRRADLFVLPCVTGADGDRDGIPNVILEAMASGLPVVSTAHSGIPEAVEDGTSGLLVPPGDPVALAEALVMLAEDEGLRRTYGEAGRKLVADSFDVSQNVQSLVEELLS